MDVSVKNLMHLKEVAREFETCQFIEGHVVQGFDPKGIFMSHLNLLVI